MIDNTCQTRLAPWPQSNQHEIPEHFRFSDQKHLFVIEVAKIVLKTKNSSYPTNINNLKIKFIDPVFLNIEIVYICCLENC